MIAQYRAWVLQIPSFPLSQGRLANEKLIFLKYTDGAVLYTHTTDKIRNYMTFQVFLL